PRFTRTAATAANAITGINKIVFFGSWDFSNAPNTFRILREATKSANRARSSTSSGLMAYMAWIWTGNTLVFLARYCTNGPACLFKQTLTLIPQAPDSPDIPPGNPEKETTINALAMITKAGVLSGKVVVGVSSYGRSFKMITAGCDRLTCTTDWAVDLQKFWPSTGDGGGIDNGDSRSEYVDENYPPCTGIYSTFEQLERSKNKISGHSMDQYILDVEIRVMETALKKYRDLVNGNYDKEFAYAEEGSHNYIERRSTHWYSYRNKGNVEVFNPKSLIGEGYELRDLLSRLKEFQAEDLHFLTGLLFFVPAIRGAIGGVALAPLCGIPSLIGPVGEAGLLVCIVIEDPDGAFMAVFAALAGAGLGRGGFRKAVDSRRDMTSAEIRSLGSVKDRLDSMNGLRQATCRAR
ncbi:hypothetical protein S40288_06044, partial [Stachybotrys chartarum IBT 40288]